MTAKELVLRHCKKSAEHHSAVAETETKIAKADVAEAHTDQILAQGHRDLAGQHSARAQHHQAHAKHFTEMHQGLAGIAPELLDEHSNAGDELRDSVVGHDLFKNFLGREAA